MTTLAEARVLDLLKTEPNSMVIFKKLCPPFSEDEVDAAFRNLAAQEIIREKLFRMVIGGKERYVGTIGHFEVLKK